jgi:cobaltochelatase CobN
MREFFNANNPGAYQSMTGRMLEAYRKGYVEFSDDIVNNLVNEYMESVADNGATCCHHTCGNPLLDEFVQGNMAAAGVSQQVIDAYKSKMFDATQRNEFQTQQQPDTSSAKVKDDSLNSVQRAMVSGSGSSNQSTMTDSGGAGLDADTPVQDSTKSTPDNYVEGYEMTNEATVTTSTDSGFTATSSDIIASVFVLGTVGVVYIGFWKRRKF